MLKEFENVGFMISAENKDQWWDSCEQGKACEQGKELSGSVKGGEVLTSLATANSKKKTGFIQGDSLGDEPESIAINHGIIYGWK
jgi:hypothetical protein